MAETIMLMESKELKKAITPVEPEVQKVSEEITEESTQSAELESTNAETLIEEKVPEIENSDQVAVEEVSESAISPEVSVEEPEEITLVSENPLIESGIREIEEKVSEIENSDQVGIGEVSESAVSPSVSIVETEVKTLASVDALVDPIVEGIDEDDFLDDEGSDSTQPVHDYSSYNKSHLVTTLRRLMGELSVEEVRPHAEAIKACFYKIRNQEIENQKEAFIAEGHEEVLFQPNVDSFEQDLKDLLKEYKNLRYEQNKKQEAVKEDNYLKKAAIIEEIKALVNSEESLNNTFQEFNELQNKWKSLGPVPQSKVKDLWETYHYQVERFYDFVKINRELRDLDLRRNMDLKAELCIKAEMLTTKEDDPQVTFKELQKLHESWREIGPVPREHKQELWDRFKIATAVINKRYQQHYEQERTSQKEQLQKKVELCEKAEEYSGFTSDNPREWNDITEKVIALQEEWKNTGYGPRKENAKIWERFRAANDAFFQNKRDFWNKSKEHLTGNMALKIEICEQAEKLKESEDWKATTDKLIALQKKWKEVGPVPRKQSEIIWKRFRTACDEFFNRKSVHFSGVTGNQDENYKAKKALIAEIEAFTPTENAAEDLQTLKKFQDRWAEIGFVPFRKKEELQNKYHEAIENQFEKLKMNEQDLGLMKFKSKIEHWASIPRGWSKINAERDRYGQRIKQLEYDLNTLGNNIGFFGTSEGAQSLVQGVNAQIERVKLQIEYLKSKMKIIDDQDEVN